MTKPHKLSAHQTEALSYLFHADRWSTMASRGGTLTSLRTRGLVRMRCIFREASEWGAAHCAETTYSLPITTQWSITNAGKAAHLQGALR